MEADDVVIEYLRGKLKKARGARAEAVLKPQQEVAEVPTEDLPPEEMAQLEALMASGGGEMEMEDDEEME